MANERGSLPVGYRLYLLQGLPGDLLEILDGRYDVVPRLITRQLPIDQWHDYLSRLLKKAALQAQLHGQGNRGGSDARE